MRSSDLQPAYGITILGYPPFARTPEGKLRSRIATAFPAHDTLVTVQGIHVTQRQAFLDHLDKVRRDRGEPTLTQEEKDTEWSQAVDLIIVEGAIQIRPDPNDMDLAFLADEMLQRIIAKHKIRFLGVLNEQVREAIKRRGELWRITPLPKTDEEMRLMIESSRMGIQGREIYYYGVLTGTRFLTFHEFEGLGRLEDSELRSHLVEIATLLGKRNAAGNPEVACFGAGAGLSRADFTRIEFAALDSASLRRAFSDLVEKFRTAVAPAFLRDDPQNLEWKNAMVAALIGHENELVTEAPLLGLSAEFFMQIEWLPGGRMEEGGLVLDPVLDADEAEGGPGDRLGDQKSRKFILNLVREYGDLEFVNIGRVIGSLSRRPAAPGRRGVYIAALKQRQNPAEIVTIIRLQKQGVREYLEQGLSILDAMIAAEEYTEYILDRRLGCRQLGMNLPVRVTAKKISERYVPEKGPGYPIWTPYFEREYIRGIATDKLPPALFVSGEFAIRCARLLGQAAAPNIIVGRCDGTGGPLFDDGDEVMVLDSEGMPSTIVVSDHTGTFNDFACPLAEFTVKYALPVTRRRSYLPDPFAFARVYCDAFEDRVQRIQDDYRKRRKAFDSLFLHLPAQEPGSFAYRWKRILARLDETNPRALADLVRGNIERFLGGIKV
jgi:hypothetical protein